MEATATRPILHRPAPTYHRIFRPASTDTIGFIKELDTLLTLENYNGFALQATSYAYENARRYLESASNIMVLPHPDFTPDGEGGIDIEWEIKGRRLALSCRAQGGQSDFISWREPDGQYDGEPASEALLKDKLDWLTR